MSNPRTIRTTALAGVIFLGSLGFATPTATADTEPDCRPLVLGIGGNGQRSAEAVGQPGLMGAQLAHEAAQGKQVESLDYKSSVWPTGPYTKDESVTDGRARATERINQYRQDCPGGHVKVIGHSLGAEFADEVGADEVVTYGDPRRPGGIYDALPGIVPGISSPGPREPGGTVTTVCHEFDAICDSPAPWSDPAKFIQGWAGYLSGWHYYAPGEADGLPPGDHYVDMPAPLPWLPESTPTGIPEAPHFALPPVEPGPLPSLMDFNPIIDAVTPDPYVPTPLSVYIPDEVETVLPSEVLTYVPPPLPEIVLPPLPDLGVRLP
ncbi:cutinase family protein [Nocardia xishanensis]|uniref:cutinase family protein n=1 Tax=Nocardia xishanensis TaxID=238964 RepID=UPI000833CB18|nr:cutinase family protein [Nocardia xishanensis]